MSSGIVLVSDKSTLGAPAPDRIRGLRNRALLGASTALAVGVAMALSAVLPAPAADPDLARLLRYMALLKGVFACLALGASYWRLARPAAAWREVIYIGGPGLMAAGALGLWQMQAAGPAAFGLHAGMFALLAAALTDPTFIPALGRRRA